MSYVGMGSYYTFAKHEVMSGFGGIEFSAAQAWGDWLACSNTWATSQKVGSTCQPAVDLLRAGLGQLGYGGLGMGAVWGGSDQQAMKRFYADHGLPSAGGMPTKAGVDLMETLIANGATPGPQKPIEFTKVGSTFVPSEKLGTAGIGLGVALLGVAVVGGIYYLARKKRGGASVIKV